jgi:hypothetical protein
MRNSSVDLQLTQEKRTVLIQRAFLLEYATLVWMILVAAVAIGSGLVVNTLVLVALRIDRWSRFPWWRSWVCSRSWSGRGLGLVGARHLRLLQLLVESASRPLGLPILLNAAP